MTVDFLRLAAIGGLLLFIQVGFGSLLQIGGVRPDLLLIFSLMIAAGRGRQAGLIAGWLSGLMQDAVSLSYLGVYALGRSTAVFWTGIWLERCEGQPKTWVWLVLFLISSFTQEAIVDIFYVQGTDLSYSSLLFRSAFPTAVYTALSGVLWVALPRPTGEKRKGLIVQKRSRRDLR
ncbi:MAG: rod shape-determining protein MreD [Calditrichota bacterium]